MTKLRVRFAPSPTGPLHIGGARSALFNYLLAKKNGGDFIVRIEDTDRDRSTPESEENIKDSLRWLGITWNEGIDVGGPYAPYRQMERLETYRAIAQKLIDEGKAYYCYCSEEEIEAERAAQQEKGETPHYSGKCRNLTEEQRKALEAQGRKPVVRFRVPAGEQILIPDLVRGDVTFESDGVGDFVIMKSDGIPTYNFAVVVDDYTMEITHVIRGEEHLSNTPRQILLYEALGYPTPKFAHISLILGKDRSKMSKRHGSVSVVNYKEQGFLPEALVNFLALLGWAPEKEEEIFTLEQLVEEFSLDRVSKSPAVFDMDKLRWLNGQYLRKLPVDAIAAGILPHLAPEWQEDKERLTLLAETMANHLSCFADIKELMPLIEGEMPEPSEQVQEVMAGEQVPTVLGVMMEKINVMEEFTPENIRTAIKQLCKETGYKGAAVYMPIRAAVTGECHGPDIDKIMALMGKEKVLARLAAAQN